MVNYNKIYLNDHALKLGFNRDILEKVTRLYDVLRFINNSPFLNQKLALKGGTAINFTVLELPRLSVDIDLDYMKNNSKEEMLMDRNAINEILSKFMQNNGYTLSSKSKNTFSLDSLVFKYLGSSGNMDNIKIEINYSLRAHIDLSENVYAIHSYFENDYSIHRLSLIEILASKINALFMRTAPRDLYDIYQIFTHKTLNELEFKHLKKSMIFYYTITSKTPEKWLDINSINKIDRRAIKRTLLPVLSKQDDFNIEEAMRIIKPIISRLLDLSSSEQLYINKFNENVFVPSLLFEDKETLSRINNHPMVKWRINSIKKQGVSL